MVALFYLIIVAIIAVNGCDDDTLLTPNETLADVTSLLPNMADGSSSTYWQANNNGFENIELYYPAEVEVKWIFIQRYNAYAQYVDIYNRTAMISKQYFGDSTELDSTVRIRFDDLNTDYLSFNFYYGLQVSISRLEVHGCYNTSLPTPSPTTAVPSQVPTSFVTVSPTLAPLAPSEMPTTRPTTAPSVSPSIANPSPSPSTVPSLSPTKLPSVETVIPSPSPTSLPTTTIHPSVAPSSSPTLEPTPAIAILPRFPSISPTLSPTVSPTVVSPSVVYATNGDPKITLGAIEFFLILSFCLCGVLLVVCLRCRKAILANKVKNHTGNPRYSVEDYMMQTRKTHSKGRVNVIQTGNGCDAKDRVMQINETRHIVGEDSRQDGNDHHVDTKTCTTREGDRQEAKDHHVDSRLSLGKVSSDKTCNIVGEDSRQDGNDHHVTSGADRQEAKDQHFDMRLSLGKVSSDSKTHHIVREDSRQDGNDHHDTRGADRQETKDHHVDIRLALDQVPSDNCEVSNSEGDHEISRRESDL